MVSRPDERDVEHALHVPANPAGAESLTNEAAIVLVSLLAVGDERAATRLWRAYGAQLYRVALGILRDGSDAEEVANHVFARAWQHAITFDGTRGAVPAWLVSMTRSRAKDVLRSRIRRERRLVSMAVGAPLHVAAPHESASECCVLEFDELRASLSRAMRKLPEAQRVVIELAFSGDASHSQIAAHLGVPIGTVKTRARLGMHKMRSELQVHYHR